LFSSTKSYFFTVLNNIVKSSLGGDFTFYFNITDGIVNKRRSSLVFISEEYQCFTISKDDSYNVSWFRVCIIDVFDLNFSSETLNMHDVIFLNVHFIFLDFFLKISVYSFFIILLFLIFSPLPLPALKYTLQILHKNRKSLPFNHWKHTLFIWVLCSFCIILDQNVFLSYFLRPIIKNKRPKQFKNCEQTK